MIPLGKVEKMQIQAFTDATAARTPVTEPYSFQVNPSTYSERFVVQYAQEQAPGNSGAEQVYQGQTPEEWEFELLLDGTGVIKEANALSISLLGAVKPMVVMDEVRKLKAATVEVQGDTHRNAYLVVSWGERDIFKGSLVSLDLNYKLFAPDGTPLRVIAKVKLRAWVSDEERVRAEGKQSPDITHERIFKASDTFSLMTYRIYDDPRYYLDVAKANNLNSFRKIPVGTKLRFPPIK
ncbi:CIS tube protein [Botryobacter ruber]|uniref:CIS tube protein n=1 Tax=Botryobacter ruber TaxID=2171629 RepID=UPI000E0A4119|nr:LysM peptidoglycan-binding domain-containing protein [Botryobacter ruber]